MLRIANLHVEREGKPILRGLNLHVPAGQVHVIMGPNGAGKSTLANVIAGWPGYSVTQGDILYEDQSLLDVPPEQRARKGIFLAFQHPVEVPGVACATFLKEAVNAIRKARGEQALDAAEFLTMAREHMTQLGMALELLHRPLNDGFSGGEKKRGEMLQLSLLQPKLAVLDEPDSGLDIDALNALADGINRLRSPTRSLLVVTHYHRLLDLVQPDRVHVLAGGRVVQSGGGELAQRVLAEGYCQVCQENTP